MGCSIHIHAELRKGDEWYHYGYYSPGKYYSVFAKLAGVRRRDDGSDGKPIIPIRGIPDGLSAVTRAAFSYWREDCHDVTWASSSEVRLLERWLQAREGNLCALEEFLAGGLGSKEIYRAAAFLFGNGWNKEALRDYGFEDFRWVIWFDN